MFEIRKDKMICLTRGDIANIVVTATLQDGSHYIFQQGDVVRLLVYKRRKCGSVMLKKDVLIAEATEKATFSLEKGDTRFCDPIDTPMDFWYEIEINPETSPQTIIGYDGSGEKIFRLYPEGGGIE